MKHVYLCQFCEAKSLAQEWEKNICPKCQKVYAPNLLSREEVLKLISFQG